MKIVADLRAKFGAGSMRTLGSGNWFPWSPSSRRLQTRRHAAGQLGRQSSAVPTVEALEERCLLAFTMANADVWSNGGSLKLVADFNQLVNVSTVQASDVVVDGSLSATAVNVVDADTVEFSLPTLAAGTHSVTIATGAMADTSGTGLDAFSRSFVVASAAQFSVKHNPRLQPGNAPLVGYAGSELDRVDLLWQTIPAGAGTQDSFTVEHRAVGATAWTSVALNADINTGIENRVVRSSSITGLNWNANYEYRVRHRRGDVIVGQYQSTFKTRLAAGDETNFTFVAYGDSASGSATGFRQVQNRVNQVNPAFAVLLGDNVYSVGSHTESDARFDPVVNPEAAAWMAGHIDYLGLGNHDVGTSSGLPSEQNFSVPIPVAGVTAPAAPVATERAEHNFSWDYGDVHFITFDTNSLSDSVRLDALLNWVVTDLNASTARWKIVYGHHPVAGVPDKTENPGQNYYQQVVNRLKAAGVDLFMTGHSHTYSWTYPLTGQINGTATYADHGHDDHFVAGEGLPQLVSGLGGVEIRPGDYSQFPFVAEGFTSGTLVPAEFGFSQVEVTQDQLTVKYIAADNGAVIDFFTINKDAAPQAATFQQGANGYSGTVDTYLHQNTPTTSFATSTSLKVDNDDPAGTALDAQTLLRFDNLFGSAVGQIPSNATLRSATLQLQVTNGSVNNMNLHRMLGTWAASDTWNSRVNGIQTDGVEALASPDTSSGQTQVGAMSFNVLSSLQAWQANPSSNFGWALIPTGTDGVDFNSSEGTTKPKLIVTYVIDNAPNVAPVANNDSATTTGGTAVTVPVLSNDSDANGDPLTVTTTTSPAHGSVVIIGGSSVTYTPTAGYYGADSFTYSISDGRGGTATATVNLMVVQSVSFQQGVSGYVGTVDTFLQQNATTTNNSAATSLNIDSDDPAGTGLDVQALLRFDNLFGSAAGQIPINATLQSASLQVQVTNSGNSVNLHRMLGNWAATDTWSSVTNGVQNDGVEAVAAADVSTSTIATGALSINVLSSLQNWQANPATNRGWVLLPTGSDGVDFDSSEGTTKPRLVVTFIPASNVPPTANNDSATTNEDSSVTIAVLSNDSDTDGGVLSVTFATNGAKGTVSINGDGTLNYVPNLNANGADSFSYTISDGQGGSATGMVSITINSVNDAPVAANDSATTNEDTAVTISVLANDSDVDGGTLSVTSKTDGAKGTVTINGDGTLSYVPNLNANGADSFTYTISDGQGGSASGTVSITINSVNDAPVASNDSTTTNEDASVTIAVLANDSDVDGGALSVTSKTNGAKGTVTINGDGTLSYVPNLNANGADSFTYTISDGQGGAATATVSITINAVNDAPVATNDAASTVGSTPVTINVLLNDSDIEASPLSTSLVTTPTNGSVVVNANGSVTYTANAAFSGIDTFTYRASDGALTSNVATVTITVAGSTKFFVVDSTADKTFQYQANGTHSSQTALAATNINARGIAANADASRLWVLDSSKTIFLYDGALTLLGSWTTNTTVKTPTGISVSGADVYLSDSQADRVFVFAGAATRTSGSSIAPTRSFALSASNGNSQDLVTDGTTVWVVQSGTTDRVFVYQASNGAALGNWTIDAANSSPTGITLDPTGASQSLWTVDITTDRVYEYANARSRRSGSQTAASSFALNALNANAQGLADPLLGGVAGNSLASIRSTDRLGSARPIGWDLIPTNAQQTALRNLNSIRSQSVARRQSAPLDAASIQRSALARTATLPAEHQQTLHALDTLFSNVLALFT